MKERIYIDTSVVGGCFDEEFERWSNNLIEEFVQGIKIIVISDLTYRELELAPDYVRKVLNDISDDYIENVFINIEAKNLAEKYLEETVLSEQYYEDALYIALATINKVTALVSWNFKHIVNLNKIRKYNSVNLKNGYQILEIRTPREILKPENDEEQ